MEVVVVTVIVEVAFPLATGVTDAGVNEHPIVTVDGAIPQVNATAELKLFREETVSVVAVVFPAVVVATAGNRFIVKSAAAPTFNV